MKTTPTYHPLTIAITANGSMVYLAPMKICTHNKILMSGRLWCPNHGRWVENGKLVKPTAWRGGCAMPVSKTGAR